MSELQQYYEAFCTGYWSSPDASECACRGSGWALSDVDTWHHCPEHYTGQRNPEDDFEGAEGEAPASAPAPAAPVAPVAFLPASDDDIPF